VAAAVNRPRIGWNSPLVPIGLYVFAASLLLVALGRHPAYPQNWEDYTTWQFFGWWDDPSARIFEINDGVMLTSGTSPLLAPFVWLSFKLFGVGMFALRLPSALISAAAAPLLFVVGRRVASARVGAVGALLLALLPSFLLYGRTATNAGLSVVPALLTIYVLLRGLQDPMRWQFFALLQVLLIVDAYAYAPIRLLWPVSLALIAVEVGLRRTARFPLAIALAATILILPAVLVSFNRLPGHNPVSAVKEYYVAHGETILTIRKNRENYKYWLELTPKERAAGRVFGSDNELLWRFLKQNARNVANLFLDRHTTRALVDYWNPHGRLYFWFLVPFFLVGLIQSAVGIFRRVEDRVLQACFWGWTVSLLGASVVNIGRAVFLFPIVALFVASGVFTTVDWIARTRPAHDGRIIFAGSAVAAALLVATAAATWNDYKKPAAAFGGAALVAQLRASAPSMSASGGSAVLIRPGGSSEIESIDISTYRVLLDDDYRFVDVAASSPSSTGGAEKPAVLYGQVMSRLARHESLPTRCTDTYFVTHEAFEDFKRLALTFAGPCGRPLHLVEVDA